MSDSVKQPPAFATHVLRGRRFDGHAVPVEVLAELEAYRELVVTIAKRLYYQDNRSSRRLPNNFEKGFQLVLRTIGEGSAELPLERVGAATLPVAQLSMVAIAGGQPDYFERARDLISDAVEAVAHGRNLPGEFPRTALPLFNSFGRSLADDEVIEMRAPARKASYDRSVRKKLVLEAAQTYEDAADVVGQVVQFDRQRMVFDLLNEGRRISGRLDTLPEEMVRIISTACAQGDQLQVRVVGLGAYDRHDRLSRFASISEVSYAEDEALKQQLDVDEQLAALAELPDGWFDQGNGPALDREGLVWLAGILKQAESQGLRRPYLYPMPDGRVQAEWPHPDAEVSAEIDIEKHVAEVSGVVIRNQATRDDVIALETEAGIGRLIDFVSVFGPEGMGAKV